MTVKSRAPVLFALLAPLGVFIFFIAFQKQRWDSDIFWALKSGEWIFENLAVPKTDPFSHTFFGEEWIDFTWGFQALAHFFYTYMGGFYGLFVLHVAVLTLIFYFLYKSLALVSSGRTWLVVASLYIILAATYGRLFIRPHLFGYLFVTIYIYLLNRYEKEGDAKYLWAVAALQVLWTNIHSSFVLGVFIVGVYTASFVVESIKRDGLSAPLASELKKALLFCFLLVPAATLLNPYGWRLSVFPFVHQGGDNAEALHFIAEWAPVSLNRLLLDVNLHDVEFVAFKLIFYGAVASFFLSKGRWKLHHFILLATALYMATSHIRWVMLLAFFVSPMVVENLSVYLDRSRGSTSRWALSVPSAALLVSVLLLYSLFVTSERANYGVGMKKGTFPEGTVAFMKAKGVAGNVHNAYDYGGYLIYNDIPVMIDGRTPTLYSPFFYWETRLAERADFWGGFAEEYGAGSALVKKESALCAVLRDDPDWTLVIFDDISALYLKEAEENMELLDEWRVSSIDPCTSGVRHSLPEGEEGLLRAKHELVRIVAFFEERGLAGRIAIVDRLLGLVYTRLGGDYMADAAASLASSTLTEENPFTYYDLGLVLSLLDRRGEAIEALERSVELEEMFSDGHFSLGAAYITAGDYEQGALHMERYIYLSSDGASYESYKLLGRACFELGLFDCAASSLRKAAFLAPDDKARADMNYKAGNNLLEAGMVEEGMAHYAVAVDIEGEYSEVLSDLAESLRSMGRTGAAEAIADLLARPVE